MQFLDRYPIIVTDRMADAAAFWARHLGFVEGFRSDWFVWLTTEDASASIAFMSPDHPSSPPGPEPYSGLGACFELQVASAQAAYDDVIATGLIPDYPLTSEPFGQIRFGFSCPSGLWVDIVEQLDPTA